MRRYIYPDCDNYISDDIIMEPSVDPEPKINWSRSSGVYRGFLIVDRSRVMEIRVPSGVVKRFSQSISRGAEKEVVEWIDRIASVLGEAQ